MAGNNDGDAVREDVLSVPVPGPVPKDRRFHGGLPPRPDDEALAERTAEERVDAGLADYVPGQVPQATDDPVDGDVTETAEYRDEVAEVDTEVAQGLIATGERPEFPPSRYPD